MKMNTMKSFPPDPGKFNNVRLKVHSEAGAYLVDEHGNVLTFHISLIACWAHTAWTAKLMELNDKPGCQIQFREAVDNAAAWAALAKE